MKIAVIGGGWYGCHIALKLRLASHDVTLFESNNDIFGGVSGKFGIRLHAGPHYPRSAKTRESCRNGLVDFAKEYPELIVEHAYSIYGLGTSDADNEPPKIDLETFKAVANENRNRREIDPKQWGYDNLLSAFDIQEPSILVGNQLRSYWKERLLSAGVNIVCRARIQNLIRISDKTIVIGNVGSEAFDYAVNATGYQALLPSPDRPLPFELNVVYQPCLALIYEDKLSHVISLPPFSFIVMDGWFPCIMPHIEDKKAVTADRKYIVTHGKYTIMGSFKTAEEANACLEKVTQAEQTEKFVTTRIQQECEAEMERFWPLFGARLPASTERRFQCVGWEGAVLAKIKTNREFRSAVTFAREGVVYIIPGKVSNIFDAERETMALINHQNVLQAGSYQYVQNGILHGAMSEITEAVDPRRNTCNLQTYAEFADSAKLASPIQLSRNDVVAFFKPAPATQTRTQEANSTPCPTSFLAEARHRLQIRASL